MTVDVSGKGVSGWAPGSMSRTKHVSSREHTVLTETAMDAFRRDGFVLVPGAFDEAAMARIARWSDELVTRPELPGRHMAYYEDSLVEPGRRVLSRIENFCPYHPEFDRLLRGASMMSWMARLFGEPAVLFKDKINFKLSGADGFKAHQDVQAGWDAYASLHITMLLSIDDAHEHNGCLELAPGHHRRGLIGSMWEPLDEGSPAIEYRAAPTRSGDVLFFDSFAPHRSGPNRSGQPRRVLYVTYNRASEGDHRDRYYADKRLSYPPDCERDRHREYVFRV